MALTAFTAFRSSPRLVVYPWRISAASLKAMTMPESESVAASISLIASALAHASRSGATSVADMLAELSRIRM